MVDIVRSLPPEPAVLCAHALHERRWVGPRLRARLVGGAWAYLWLHTRDLVLLVCDITLSFLRTELFFCAHADFRENLHTQKYSLSL